jgi:transcription initiation factor TFIIIB Brf1 subunit/transcription initiation factor TFIIB
LEDKSLKEVQAIIPQEMRPIRDPLNYQKRADPKRFSSKTVLLFAHKVWKDESVAELIATETSEIINAVYNKRRLFFSGRSAKGVLSGIFYLLGRKNNAKKTQREIARSLNTNDVTIRDSYHDWLDAFPDLFDAI